MSTSNFRRLHKGALNQEVIVPLLRAYFANPTFPSRLLPIEGFDIRDPDGWFHPSTHPTWPARMLYYYLTEPEKLIPEPPDPVFVLSVTQGKFWHSLIQHIGADMGFLQINPNPLSEWDPTEFAFSDEDTRSRGAVDGITNSDYLSIDEPEVFEFKTMHPAKIEKMPLAPPDSEEVRAWFYEKCFDYVTQGQEYLRLSGYRRWRGLIMSVSGAPFTMREVVMDFDPKLAYGIRDHYRRVIAAAEAGTPPHNCCNPRSADSKVCPARSICPVALI